MYQDYLELIEQINLIKPNTNLTTKIDFEKYKIDKEKMKIFLNILVEKNYLSLLSNGEIKKIEKNTIYIGKLYKKKNFGFVEVTGFEDFFVKHVEKYLNYDIVLVKEMNTRGKSKEVKILGLIERKEQILMAKVSIKKNIIPLDEKFGDKKINIVDYDYSLLKPKEIIKLQILGVTKNTIRTKFIDIVTFDNKLEAGEKIILSKYNIQTEIDSKLVSNLKTEEVIVNSDTLKDRQDLRDKLFMTIDGKHSKDLDDAICLIEKENKYHILVSIADVSHYVKEDTLLDKSAEKKATSIYYLNKVISMLPVQLSNGICSLHPGVDRLTLTCEIILNTKFEIIDYQIYKSVINSKYRLTYDEVNDILENKKEVLDKYQNIDSILIKINKIAKILKEKRLARGAFNIEDNESKFIFDKTNKIIDIVPTVRKDAEKLIEELMILANETVTKYALKNKYPFIYRVHGNPNSKKLKDLEKVLYYLKINDSLNLENISPQEIRDLLEKIKNPIFKRVISKMVVRSLPKAEYSIENIGHFGLASQNYTHFTSPIRRYPDLMVHRLLKQYIDKNFQKENIKKINIDKLKLQAKHSSEQEMTAIRVEQEIEDYKKAEYMQEFISQSFKGTISGIEDYGIFVELANTVRGLIRFKDLKDFLAIKNFTVEFKTGQTLSFGDEIEVIVIGVNINRGLVDFVPKGFNYFTLKEKKIQKEKEKREKYNPRQKLKKFEKSKNKTPKLNKKRRNSTIRNKKRKNK